MFSVQRRVEFRDTDAAGIVHFSAFFPMMESAEHEALRQLGLSVMQATPDEGHITWPRVSAKCDYSHAARFEDLLDIDVSVARLGNSSVTYAFTFRLAEKTIARGEITAVCCLWSPSRPLQKMPIPDNYRSAFRHLMTPADRADGVEN